MSAALHSTLRRLPRSTSVYKDLPHPPSTFLGRPPLPAISPATLSTASVTLNGNGGPIPPPVMYEGKPYAYRAPDGANNNPLFPDLGRAGMPYARSVPPSKAVPLSALPDPGVAFDVLLRRKSVRCPACACAATRE